MGKIKVLLISQPNTAGVKRHIMDVMARIDLERFEVRFAYNMIGCDPDFPALLESVKSRGVRAFEVSTLNRPSLKHDGPAFVRLLREIRTWRPHVVHCHSSKAGVLGRVAARLAGTGAKTVFTPNVLSVYNGKIYFPIEAALAPLTDVMVASCESEASDFRKLGIYGGCEIRTIPLCVDSSLFPPAMTLRRQGPLRIASCGRIAPQKNALLFFRTALAAAHAGLDWEFEWVGDYFNSGTDTESEACRALLKEHPEMNLEITGWLDDARDRLARADIFLLLSRYESFGFVTAEAMLLGRPVVASRTTGNVDLVVEGETGCFVEQDERDILAKIKRLADDPHFADYGRRGRERVMKEFPISRMIGLTEKLYSDLVPSAA